MLSLLPVAVYILKDLGDLASRLPRLRAAVREGELGGRQDVEYLGGALLAPLNVDLYYQRRIVCMPTERISSELRVLVPCR